MGGYKANSIACIVRTSMRIFTGDVNSFPDSNV